MENQTLDAWIFVANLVGGNSGKGRTNQLHLSGGFLGKGDQPTSYPSYNRGSIPIFDLQPVPLSSWGFLGLYRDQPASSPGSILGSEHPKGDASRVRFGGTAARISRASVPAAQKSPRGKSRDPTFCLWFWIGGRRGEAGGGGRVSRFSWSGGSGPQTFKLLVVVGSPFRWTPLVRPPFAANVYLLWVFWQKNGVDIALPVGSEW